MSRIELLYKPAYLPPFSTLFFNTLFIPLLNPSSQSPLTYRYAYSVELTQLENDDEWQKAGLGDGSTSTNTTITAVHHSGGHRGEDREDAEYGGDTSALPPSPPPSTP